LRPDVLVIVILTLPPVKATVTVKLLDAYQAAAMRLLLGGEPLGSSRPRTSLV
jgi:hypothetical protein